MSEQPSSKPPSSQLLRAAAGLAVGCCVCWVASPAPELRTWRQLAWFAPPAAALPVPSAPATVLASTQTASSPTWQAGLQATGLQYTCLVTEGWVDGAFQPQRYRQQRLTSRLSPSPSTHNRTNGRAWSTPYCPTCPPGTCVPPTAEHMAVATAGKHTTYPCSAA